MQKKYNFPSFDRVTYKLLTAENKGSTYYLDAWFICEQCSGNGWFNSVKGKEPDTICESCVGTGKVKLSLEVKRG